MSIWIRLILTGIILFLIDLYFYQAFVTVIRGSTAFKKSLIFYSYWSWTLFSFIVIAIVVNGHYHTLPKFFKLYVFAIVLLIVICKVAGSLFLLIDDLVRLIRWLYYRVAGQPDIIPHASSQKGISRLKFLNYMALGIAAIPFAGFLYGMVRGAFNYQVHRSRVVLPKLPAAFNGLKIVQISDIHSGSFISNGPLEEAVAMVNALQPDIIFFTGDLVNNEASEVEPFLDTLGKLKAPMGIFSTLGNHDYGDYISWPDAATKAKNLETLKRHHAALGWKLMMNEHVPLMRNDEAIALLGIENWGGNLNFPKYGDLAKAYQGTEMYPVKLLLSHDPSHWDKQVVPEYPDIDITFSGHTHGFQFGIEIPGFKWSPSQYVYKEWAGLYSNDKHQYVYVNRGLGFLGYPGRLGISPEITVMELFNS